MGYYPRTDISKNVDGMLIEIAICGLSEDEVSVDLASSSIVVRGVIPDRDEYSKYAAKELYRGRFSRTYPFNSSQHDLDKIECTMENGLLTVFIPYKAKNKQTSNIRSLTIKDIDTDKENENGDT
jgi:HSP20 family molecular chaperone IbpA